MTALPVSVFSAAFFAAPVPAALMDLPDLTPFMEMVDDEDLESTEIIAGMAGWCDPRFPEYTTELLDRSAEAILVG
jgi:hypothetical protein